MSEEDQLERVTLLLAALADLVFDTLPKCFQCGEPATRIYPCDTRISRPMHSCDEHHWDRDDPPLDLPHAKALRALSDTVNEAQP